MRLISENFFDIGTIVDDKQRFFANKENLGKENFLQIKLNFKMSVTKESFFKDHKFHGICVKL